MADDNWDSLYVKLPSTTRKTTEPGFVSRAEEETLQAEAEQQSFGKTVSDAFTSGDNILWQTAAAIDRKIKAGPVDENWKGDTVSDWIKANNIDPYDEWRYRATRNANEAGMLRAQQKYNEDTQSRLAKRGGFSTFVAQSLVGAFDIDAPVALMTGGLSATARVGYTATKAGRLLTGAAAGALTLGGAGAVSHAVNPAEDWTVIPSMMLMGGAFGAVGGALAPDNLRLKANAQLDGVRNDFGENVAAGTPFARQADSAPQVYDVDPYGSRARMEASEIIEGAEEVPRAPTSFDVEEVQVDKQGGSSAGAAQVKPSKTIADIDGEQSRLIIENMKQRDAQLGLEAKLDDTLLSSNDAIGKGLNVFQRLLDRMPFTTDFNRLTRTQSAVGRVLAYDIMESASGMFRNNDNAARYLKQYQTQALHIVKDVPQMFQAWANDVHSAGILTSNLREDIRLEFNNLLRQEMNNRYYQRVNPNVHPTIKQAADALDDAYEYLGSIEKGRPGQGSVSGMAEWKKRSGYVPQQWASGAYQRMRDSGRSHKEIAQAIYENYKSVYPKISDADLKVYARALADRMQRGTADSSSSIVSWVNMDGRAAVEAFLMRQSGVTADRAKSIVDSLTGSRETAGRAGYTKQRMDVDWDFTASNGIKVSDLLENDMYGMVVRRAHSSSGRAALARKGIYSRKDWENITNALLDEQNELVQRVKTKSSPTGNAQRDSAQKIADGVQDWMDNPTAISRDDMDQMYKYFMGTPLYGGTDKWISSMKKLSNLALLGQLGFAQAAEFGVTVAAMGAKKFITELPRAVREAVSDPGSGLYQDLRALGTYTPDDRLHRFDQVYATEAMQTDSAWFNKFNHMMNTAGRIQGFTSLFFHMQRTQHTMAVDAGVNRLFQHYNGTRVMEPARLRDMTGDSMSLNRILKYHVDQGTVTFDKDGFVEKLNLDKWDVYDVEQFSRAINAYTHQLIQRPLVGESSISFYNGSIASLFWHLKSFPMLAMEKQFIRNARIGDGEAIGAFLYSLGTAALAYTAKNAINLRDDNLDFEKIVDGAFKMNNIAGWLPMWTDPVGGMLGLNTDYGRSTSILSTPAAIPTIDRMLSIPGSFFKSDLGRSDVYALQALPVVGNMIGVTAIANTWKDAISENRKAERAAAKRAEQAEKQPETGTQEQVDAAVMQQLGLN